MNEFFGEHLLLTTEASRRLYKTVKDLPVIDYHCHLNQKEIAADKQYTDIGEMWLSADHYKWRAMRLCGVDEKYVTGDAGFKEKFFKYAEIMPKLFGNPLYYFSHLELKQVFGICKPLNKDTAEETYQTANEKLKHLSVQKILKDFNVEYIATTDDPADELSDHKEYNGITVAPTFRPDKHLSFDPAHLGRLAKAAGVTIKTVKDLKTALSRRLDFFVLKGCKIADHGFEDFPMSCASDSEAEEIFKGIQEVVKEVEKNGSTYDYTEFDEDTDALWGNLIVWLLQEYKKRNIVCQLHFSVTRNINGVYKDKPDSGFDVMTRECDYDSLAALLNEIPESKRPAIILYSLNPNATAHLCNLSGAFRNVFVGAAWWFNDSLEGIRRHLKEVAEYAALGTFLGMLTDSRSFLSYSRFDFFRRILCEYVGQKVEGGEYGECCAENLVKDICYNNIKTILKI